MRLIDGWAKSWRLFSVQANAIGLGIVASYASLPSEFKAAIPQEWVMGAAGATFALGLIGRLVHQPVKAPEDTP